MYISSGIVALLCLVSINVYMYIHITQCCLFSLQWSPLWHWYDTRARMFHKAIVEGRSQGQWTWRRMYMSHYQSVEDITSSCIYITFTVMCHCIFNWNVYMYYTCISLNNMQLWGNMYMYTHTKWWLLCPILYVSWIEVLAESFWSLKFSLPTFT